MIFSPIPCTSCNECVRWPRWRKTSPGEYNPLCWQCYAQSYLIVTLARRAALEKAGR